MLIYIAARRPDGPWPDLVLVGAAIGEGDESAAREAIGDGTPDLAVLQELLSSRAVRGILAIARDPEVEEIASLSRCFMGLYFRLRVLQQAGLMQAESGPSLFFRVPLDMVREAQAGLEGAAGQYGAARAVFVAPDSPGSAGRVAGELARLVSASYTGTPLLREVDQAVSKPGQPSGWVHYTLRPDCLCPACRARRLIAAPPSNQPVRLPPPRYGVPLERAGLPQKVIGSLRSAGIRNLTVTGRSKPASSNRVKPGHLSGLVHCAPNEALRASSRRNGRRRRGRDQAEIVRLR